MKKSIVSISVVCVAFVVMASCHGPADTSVSRESGVVSPTQIAIAIDTSAPLAEVDPRFLSFAVDASQVVGGNWWSASGEVEIGVGETRAEPYDFSRPALRRLAGELAPAFLRIGGSEADKIWYDMTGQEVVYPPAGYEFPLTAPVWDAVNEFAIDLGLDVFFTLNAGPGPRGDGRAWTPDNARVLLEYTAERGYPVSVWELGNEINGFVMIHGPKWIFTGAEYARDMATARALLDDAHPGAWLAGPSSAVWPVIGEWLPVLPGFLREGAGGADVVTWHYYPTQSRRCPIALRPATPTLLLFPPFLDEMAEQAARVLELRDRFAPGLPVWLGETGNAQCGGEPGISDRFAGTLWWLDELGLAARTGQRVVVRQTLSGSDYGMIDDATLRPRPDYFASVLWKRLMGETVLDARRESGDGLVRVYAHCAKGGGVAAVAINLDAAPRKLNFEGLAGESAETYALTADVLTSADMRLNGEILATSSSGELPPMRPATRALDALELAPRSAAFVVFPDADVPACAAN
ncbi:MAG: hypothetical protein IT350_16950 [Deltaproteobacteria bacterium]|nr:hypothetical protein [Deltaproteobacteria bacterium]